jgi:hypothetical protein
MIEGYADHDANKRASAAWVRTGGGHRLRLRY